jgi:hypothetical protein
MNKFRDLTFAAAFGLLATHELDAVRCAEWRVLPLTRYFHEDIGMSIFILAHIPLLAWLSAVCWSGEVQGQGKARQLFAAFCCVHVGLHWLFRNDPNYAFTGWLSSGLIGGAGLAGGLFLFLSWQQRKQTK